MLDSAKDCTLHISDPHLEYAVKCAWNPYVTKDVKNRKRNQGSDLGEPIRMRPPKERNER